jgi:predicted Na+-dependent transporter
MHIVLLGLTRVGTKLLHLNREDRITAFFVAPQKTIALGVPLLALYFRDDPAVFAAAVFPLSFYHFWQMIMASTLAGVFRKEARTT